MFSHRCLTAAKVWKKLGKEKVELSQVFGVETHALNEDLMPDSIAQKSSFLPCPDVMHSNDVTCQPLCTIPDPHCILLSHMLRQFS